MQMPHSVLSLDHTPVVGVKYINDGPARWLQSRHISEDSILRIFPEAQKMSFPFTIVSSGKSLPATDVLFN
jgi:hypothetical protein